MNIRPFRDKRPKIAKSAFVDLMACVIGDATLEDDVSVWPMAVIRADINAIKIGARSNIQDGAVLHVDVSESNTAGFPLIIGEDVTVGHGVVLHGCTIGNRCLIGMNATILNGAILGDDIVIGANSLVPQGKKLESGFLYFGNPVKQIRPLTAEEKRAMQMNVDNYVGWKDEMKTTTKNG